MANQSHADVAAKVRGIAAEQRIRTADMAEELSLSRMAIHRRLSGEVAFSINELIALAGRFSVPVAAFFDETAIKSLEAAS